MQGAEWSGGKGGREVGVFIKGKHKESLWCGSCLVSGLWWWREAFTDGKELYRTSYTEMSTSKTREI